MTTKTDKEAVVALRQAQVHEAEERLKNETKRLKQEIANAKSDLKQAQDGVANTTMDTDPLPDEKTIVQGAES